jgi:hypothetical protein
VVAKIGPGILVIVVCGAIVVYFVWSWLRVDVSRGEGAEDVRYRQPVTVRVRRKRGGNAFVAAKSPGRPLVLTVRGEVISIRRPGFSRRLAAVLSLDFTFSARELRMRSRSVGRRPLFRRLPAVVLFGPGTRGLEIAIAPKDGDVERLRQTLMSAGVKENDPPSL